MKPWMLALGLMAFVGLLALYGQRASKQDELLASDSMALKITGKGRPNRVERVERSLIVEDACKMVACWVLSLSTSEGSVFTLESPSLPGVGEKCELSGSGSLPERPHEYMLVTATAERTSKSRWKLRIISVYGAELFMAEGEKILVAIIDE